MIRFHKGFPAAIIAIMVFSALSVAAAEKVYRGWLGIGLRSLKQSEVRSNYQGRIGAVVENVFNDSPAEDAGLQAGDLITRIDGANIKAYDHLVQIVSAHKIDDVISLTVYREGETFTVSVRLDYAPEDLVDRYSKSVGSTKLGFDALGIDQATARRLDVDYFDGMLVQSVLPEGPAGKAGLVAEDVIRSIDNKTIRFVEDFNAAIEAMPAGADFSILIERNGTQHTLFGTVPGRNEAESEAEVHQEELVTDDDLLAEVDDDSGSATASGPAVVASFEKKKRDYSSDSGGSLGSRKTAAVESGPPTASLPKPAPEKIIALKARIYPERFATAEGRSTRFHLLAGSKAPGAPTALFVTELKATELAAKLTAAGVIDGSELSLRVVLPTGKRVELIKLVGGLSDEVLVAIEPQRKDTSDLVSLAAFYRNGLCLLAMRDLSLLDYGAKPKRISPVSGLPQDGSEVLIELLFTPPLSRTDR